METNTMFALVCAFVGVSDIVVARVLAGKISAIGQKALTFGGVAFLALAVLFAMRVVRI